MTIRQRAEVLAEVWMRGECGAVMEALESTPDAAAVALAVYDELASRPDVHDMRFIYGLIERAESQRERREHVRASDHGRSQVEG